MFERARDAEGGGDGRWEMVYVRVNPCRCQSLNLTVEISEKVVAFFLILKGSHTEQSYKVMSTLNTGCSSSPATFILNQKKKKKVKLLTDCETIPDKEISVKQT